jgi:hypothetical protein
MRKIARKKMTKAVQLALLSFSILALYTKYYLSFRNGFIDLLSDMAARNSLTGLEGGLRTYYTGLPFLDQFLAACVIFCWPIFHPTMPSLPLYALAFAGSVLPMWAIIILQKCRRKCFRRAMIEYDMKWILLSSTINS